MKIIPRPFGELKYYMYFCPMKKLIKALILGYALLWVIDSVKKMLGDKEINSLDDIKQLIKENL
jgi:hypothetical protein